MHPPHPDCRVGGRTFPVFRVCGYVGFAAGTAVALGGAYANGLDMWRMALLCALAAATYFVVSRALWIVTGRRTLVWYHYLLVVLAVSALAAPDRAYLDIEVMGLGVFHAFARLGCFAAGCCHGRPARSGVRYSSAHVAAGFPAYYEGLPLVPVQLLEAAVSLCAAFAGQGVAGYLAIYACGRFGLEFLRGDGCRAYWFGLTEAQWTSLAVIGGVAWWHPPLLAAFPLLLAVRWWAGRTQVVRPADLAGVVDAMRRPGEGLTLFQTASGLNVSCSPGHVAFSVPGRALTVAQGKGLAELVDACRGGGEARMIPGGAGVLHVVTTESARPC